MEDVNTHIFSKKIGVQC